jgi:hypothetical protein
LFVESFPKLKAVLIILLGLLTHINKAVFLVLNSESIFSQFLKAGESHWTFAYVILERVSQVGHHLDDIECALTVNLELTLKFENALHVELEHVEIFHSKVVVVNQVEHRLNANDVVGDELMIEVTSDHFLHDVEEVVVHQLQHDEKVIQPFVAESFP